MWISNICYLFFSIKISVITQMRLLPNIRNKRMKSQNPDCLNISKRIEKKKKKTLMIYYSFSIYTTDIDRIGRVMMIVMVVSSFSSVINADELLINKTRCSISWMTNESKYTCLLIHCLLSICMYIQWSIDRFVSRYTHVCVCVCWHLIGLKRACRAESSVLYTGRRDWTAISF
jgi:hypothetical protein